MKNILIVFCCLLVSAQIWARHDPTAPMFESSDTDGQIRVEGIFITPSKRLALISGKYYVVGDNINGDKITAILRDKVVIYSKQEKKVYPLTKKIRNIK